MGKAPVLFQTSPEDMNQNRQGMTLDKLIDPKDINQGDTGDCYFLSAITSLAGKYPELISDLFVFDANEANYYVVKLFLEGRWTYVKTDDRFPVVENIPVQTHSLTNEIWSMLLEKAFAESYGSYEAIEGGYPSEAFLVLTGAPYLLLQVEGRNPD